MNLPKGVLLWLVGVLIALSALMLLPFIQYIIAAFLVAFTLFPLQRRLEAHLPASASAFALVCLAIAVVVVPLVVLLRSVANSAQRLLEAIEEDGLGLDEVERELEELTGYEVDITDEVTRSARDIASTALDLSTDAIGTFTYHLLGVALALFLLYYLLKDGDDLLAWLYETVPLPGELQREITAEVKAVTWGVLFGHVFVGVIQGVVAGIGFAVVGVPNTLFWTAVMVVLAMIPLIGTIPIWGGAVVYLALMGEPELAVGLFVYSVVVVGVTDDYLRPFAVDRYAELNPAAILVGILGGAYAFGVMGLFIGPILIGALRASVEVGREHWDDLEEFEVA